MSFLSSLCDFYVTNELRVNSVLSQFDFERKSLFNCMTYYFAISHTIQVKHIFSREGIPPIYVIS